MSRSVPTVPQFIDATTVPLTAGATLILGTALVVDPATGRCIPSDNTAPAPLVCIGVAANNAQAGGTVYVKIGGTILIPTRGATIQDGHWAGDSDGTGKLQDQGAGLDSVDGESGSGGESCAGIVLATVGGNFLLLVQPYTFIEFTPAPPPVIPTVPNFSANETPSTFNTNIDYDLANIPSPAESLQVFIDDTALGVNGCNKLMVQGVDYTLTNGGSRIHFGVTTTVNKIRCWYQY